MIGLRLTAALLLTSVGLSAAQAGVQNVPGDAAVDLTAAISQLGSFDFDTRTAAARRIRRLPVTAVIPELERAVRSHPDEYVRFRALVIVAGMSQEARPLIQSVMTDRNDRLRTVAFQWLEHHPDAAVVPTLVAALARERSEFVRPALTRAIAAHSADPRAREALLPLVARGEDLFRGALIEALGDYRATWAVGEIAVVATLDGPLQDDAITALGKIGDPAVRPTLVALQRSAPPETQPTISAAFCLLKVDCERQEAYLRETLAFAIKGRDTQSLLRGVAHALGMLAVNGRPWALVALLDAGVAAGEPGRDTIALTVGLVALRRPDLLLDVITGRPDLEPTMGVVLDAFDMLSEDFEEERFYVEIRHAYWASADGSPRRRAAEQMISTLEF